MVISINMVNVLQFIINWFIIFINWFTIFVNLQTRNDATQVHQHTYLNRYTYINLHGRKKFMYCSYSSIHQYLLYSSFNIICIYSFLSIYYIIHHIKFMFGSSNVFIQI
eukprot:963578_1